MRIDNTKFGLYSYQNQVNRLNVKDTNKRTSVDDVQISAKGQELSQALQSDQLDRQKKIEAIKNQIADGSYKVDTNKVAEKMIDFWKK
ncbi:MAG TPA: flagellar biosynthesis anti-sigma factor FlgM [Bacillota bacterium]|nr:flagellar biosynthesis anti-sigma factor FlgM [Bacillota bacterium]